MSRTATIAAVVIVATTGFRRHRDHLCRLRPTVIAILLIAV